VAALKACLAGLALASAQPAAAQNVAWWSSESAEASARFGVPREWIERVMRVESGGMPLLAGRPVVSPAGAMGLMQLMPATWQDMRGALRLGNDPFDPHDNILAGTAYLRMMYDRFGYPGLFAAYNAGPARYAGFLTGARPLPPETRAYVGKTANAILAPSVSGSSRAAVIRMIERPKPPMFVIRSTEAKPSAPRPIQAGAGLFAVRRGDAE
jgi:soluble lytic murein transglycosylase-like protein